MGQDSDEKWHSKEPEEIAKRLNVDLSLGLTEKEAKLRLEQHGRNKLKEIAGKSALRLFIDQFLSTLILLLIAASVISYFIGNIKDTIVILIIVFLNALLGFVQEYRAEKAIAALRLLEANYVQALRDGNVQNIPAELLVPGDVVIIEAGSRVPADLRLIKTFDLKVNESALTGESLPVTKKESVVEIGDKPSLADRHNMIFSGTSVSYGRGTGIVVATGMNTELGKIALLIQSIKAEKTSLQKRMSKLGKQLTGVAIALVFIIFIAGIARGLEAKIMLLTAISLAVAAVPEGLPALITIALSLGAQKMTSEKALVRKLPAVETLGSVTLICSDKTGTLTENKMTVKLAYANSVAFTIDKNAIKPSGNEDLGPKGRDSLTLLFKSSVLCNNAFLEKTAGNQGFQIVGDPTEGALLEAARLLEIDKAEAEKNEPRIEEIPFTSERKRMTTINKTDRGYVAYSKGAVDILLSACDYFLQNGEAKPLSSKDKAHILRINDEWAGRGTRVLGVAYRDISPTVNLKDEKEVEKELVFIGMMGMTDPPRKEVKEAIRICRQAGIRPVMITGDHMLTAMAIAKELDMCDERCGVISGSELETMSLEELEKAIDEVSVYARVSPQHKLKLIDAYKDRGQIVAMTGDGVNDAPALKKADIGVAMGITGTDVSKEASDMILMDDNFATIVTAVKEGRVIYDNIRKFFRYLLSTNSGEILTMFFGIILGFPLPILPIQILWINLVTDGLPAIALGFEKAEPDTMMRPPRDPKESLFARRLGVHVVWVGFFIAAGTLGVFRSALSRPSDQTMAFMTLAFFQMFHVLAIRSEKESLFKQGIFSNKLLIGAVFLTFALQLSITYLKPLQAIFDTVSLSITELLLCVAVSSLIFFAVEIEKSILRTKTLIN